MLSLKSPNYLFLQPFGCARFPYLRPPMLSTSSVFIPLNASLLGIVMVMQAINVCILLVVSMFLDMFSLIQMIFLILVCFSLFRLHLVFFLLFLVSVYFGISVIPFFSFLYSSTTFGFFLLIILYSFFSCCFCFSAFICYSSTSFSCVLFILVLSIVGAFFGVASSLSCS